MVDAMNHDNFKQPSTYDSKEKYIATVEAKYSNTN
jgi:hypothetical protein